MSYQKYEELREQLQALMEAGDYLALRQLMLSMNEVDLAAFLDEVKPGTTAVLFRMLPKDTGAEVFSYLTAETQEELINAYTDREVEDLVAGLFNDDLTDLMEELPAGVAKRILQHTPLERRQLVNRLLQYPEESAGSIMTTEYLHLKRDMTVAEAIQKLRHVSQRIEMIYTCFVTSADRVLEGVLTVREILNSEDSVLLGEIMERQVVAVQTSDDREQVARLFDRYNFLAVPVVDKEHRLVGIVTVDDAVDVLQEETSEDFSVMAAVQPGERPYLATGVMEHARRRIVWLLLLMISGMLNGLILERYEQAFILLPILVTFIPMLTDTGGNAGSQSSGLMIRALALGEIGVRDLGRVIWKESRIAIVVGCALGAVNFLRIYYLGGQSLAVAFAVSLALLVTVLAAKLIGGALPIVAKSLKMDPALMAAPLITTIVDALSLVIFFELSSWILA